MKLQQSISVTSEIHRQALSEGNDRQADHAGRALGLLRAAAVRQEMRANRKWTRLDAQAVDLQRTLSEARARGDARAEDLARRALVVVAKEMEKLLGGPGAIAAARAPKGPAAQDGLPDDPRKIGPWPGEPSTQKSRSGRKA